MKRLMIAAAFALATATAASGRQPPPDKAWLASLGDQAEFVCDDYPDTCILAPDACAERDSVRIDRVCLAAWRRAERTERRRRERADRRESRQRDQRMEGKERCELRTRR